MNLARPILLILIISTLLGCDFNYWWSRGQPPAPSELVSKAEARFDEKFAVAKNQRVKMATAAFDIKSLLLSSLKEIQPGSSVSGPASQSIASKLSDIEERFIAIEPDLYVGSRAPYSELSGQLRTLTKSAAAGEKVDHGVLSTFTSRTLFFLAGEMEMPEPSA